MRVKKEMNWFQTMNRQVVTNGAHTRVNLRALIRPRVVILLASSSLSICSPAHRSSVPPT